MRSSRRGSAPATEMRALSQSRTASTKAVNAVSSRPSASPSACRSRGSTAGSAPSIALTRSRTCSAVPPSRSSARATLPSEAAAAALISASSGVALRARRRPRAPRPRRRAARSASRRQRERMVGSRRPGAWLTTSSRDSRRRLLEDLQQRVGAGGIQLVRRVDDADAPAPLARGRAEEADRAPHLVDRDDGAQLALVVFGALQREQIGDGPARRRGAPRRDVGGSASDVASCALGAVGSRMREHEARHAVGERRLADAARPADQPGMRHAAGAIGFEERLFGARRGRKAPAVCARMRDVGFGRPRSRLTKRPGSSAAPPDGAARSPRPRRTRRRSRHRRSR